MTSQTFMREPCEHCPFRRDVRPFLRSGRAYEISRGATNPYSTFHCHKTLGHDDEEGDTCVTSKSLICAGFLAIQINEAGIKTPEGFTFPHNVYSDVWEMVGAYEDAENGEWEP